MTLSGSDKANDLLSSQIDSLICLRDEIKDNDRQGFQTLLFNFTPFMSLGKASRSEIEYDRGWNVSRDLTILVTPFAHTPLLLSRHSINVGEANEA